ncbi:hypothetical protein NQ317_012213 [Molorchus minor]|uniref:Endonuclease n=1 Tax=Molorchus minor TaxID=1323400 RepID=A0ABQ9IY69_9CUCU|nr:hypothetical protein NQ317_012213 [Molorchus minor]
MAQKHDAMKAAASDIYEEFLAADAKVDSPTGGYVFLETLRVRINGPCGSRDIRALIDTGSQRSYILKSTAQQLGYRSNRQITIVHCLFGGIEQSQTHDCFDVRLSNGGFSCIMEVLDQPTICKDISPVFEGPWMEEVKRLNVHLSDVRGTGPIKLLIGADFAGRLYTGRRHILQCGLVVAVTLLGWTLTGRILDNLRTCTTMTVISLLVNDSCITDLWKLDVLGITDPSEKRKRLILSTAQRDEMATAAKEYFLETVAVDESGRYEVRLPWLDGHPSLPNNYHLAKKRLETIVKRLNKDGLFDSYDQVFQEWLQDDVIEEVSVEEGSNVSNRYHYLPHRPVTKEHSTTKIRPVFDASARDKDRPLNHCLEKVTIQHHPSEKLKLRTPYSQETIVRLSKSFYVDNCVTSVSTEDILEQFILESSMLMAEAKFDLRGWESTQPTGHTNVPVLGLTWNAKKDVLTISDGWLKDVKNLQDKVITKRLILSTAQRVFDPIGFTSPATLIPKVLLQRTWEKRQGWDTPHEGPLTGDEFDAAEVFVFKVIQQETFPDTRDKTLCSLYPVRDELGLLRLKSRVSNRQDIDTFRFPVIWSAKHPVVRRLIFDLHEKSCHIGTQGLLSLLHEKFWIVGGRRAVRSVISKCVVCKRHCGTSCNVESPPLPLNRVRDAALFEVTGIDFAGPLFLKTGEKAWVPLTYMSDEPKDLISLTSAMFLQDLVENGIPDCDAVDRASLCRRIRYKQKLREHLRNRFRSEYLGQLKLIGGKRPLGKVSLGDVVLIGNDNKKRLTWPLGRIVELIPGKDGTVRLVRVDTAKGQLLRPLQRIYPLECSDVKEIGKEIPNAETSASDTDDRSRQLRLELHDQVCDNASAGVYKSRVPDANVYVTRSGRLVKQPSRFKE